MHCRHAQSRLLQTLRTAQLIYRIRSWPPSAQRHLRYVNSILTYCSNLATAVGRSLTVTQLPAGTSKPPLPAHLVSFSRSRDYGMLTSADHQGGEEPRPCQQSACARARRPIVEGDS